MAMINELEDLQEQLMTTETLIESIGVPDDASDQQLISGLLAECDVIKAAILEANSHEQPIPQPSIPDPQLQYGFN
jgi:hypothetical protein